jgi:hypothetical protein
VTAAVGIDAAFVSDVERILEDRRVREALAPLGGTVRFHVEAIVAPGLPVHAAHGNWQAGRIGALDGLAPFARQREDALTPSPLVRVLCECVHEPSGGMSSYYGFRGYFVSLLVSVEAGAIWDARVDEAS